MSNHPEGDAASQPNGKRTKTGIVIKIAVPVVAVLAAYFLFARKPQETDWGVTFAAKKGPLSIKVIEGGNISAIESQRIMSQIKGETKILQIVDEGYSVTEEDVANGKVLVTLDNAALLEDLTQQEIQYQSSVAAYTEAKEQFTIQTKENESLIKTAELKVKFARLDFEKFVGASIAKSILDAVDAAYQKAYDGGGPATATQLPDLVAMANNSNLEGEAKQKLRTLASSRVVSEQEGLQSKNRLDWTTKLYDKKFVTQSDMESDKMMVLKSEIELESSKTAEELYLRYEFPKEVERLLSEYQKALLELDVTRRQAVGKQAQAEARLKSAEATYSLQSTRRDDLKDQLAKCEIKAERVGLVVYAGSDEGWRGNEARIEEGAAIRQRQEIITIPDMKTMSVDVKVHESQVKRIKKGQKAKIRVDANAEQELTGEVLKVSVLPDSSSRWSNPDLKVYATTVTISQMLDWLKPGMSAKVEILVDELPDVVYVPIQAVFESQGEKVCYVVNSGWSSERRVVDVGEFSQEFIEIRKGLTEGETVMLRAPESERLKDSAEGATKSQAKNPTKGQTESKVERPETSGDNQSAPAGDASQRGGRRGGGGAGRNRPRTE